jgi:basic amino acid/polyamine antiporter, APA family
MAQLARRLETTDAVFIGLGSMLGAGVFAAFTPAAQAAGSGLLVGLVVAAIVAFCNATSSAQLAAAYPTSGGTYVYGRERLGEWWGFIAGWSFIVGKVASCAAMALTFAVYAAPVEWEKHFAIAAVVIIGAVNYLGVSKTAAVTRVLVVIVGVALTLGVAANASTGLEFGGLDLMAEGPYGILQSAGLLFFAFAGYARIATMGEEVRDPQRTIPRAIVLALGIVVVIYAIVAVVLLGALGPETLATTDTPLAVGPLADIVRFGAAAAALGALLGLMAGIGRTALAMARERDLPSWLSAVHPRFRVPHRAELVLTLVIVVLVAVTDVRNAIGFSSFGVLVYYFVANVAAFTQGADARRYPRAVQVAGALLCIVLVVTLPVSSILGGLIVIAVGVAYRAVRVRLG